MGSSRRGGAGRLGLRERALALDLRQAGVYLFHNGLEHKLFIDGRLEIPSRSTFEMFVRLSALLEEGRPGWAEAVPRIGNPLVLLDHAEDFGAEATLLSHAGWRCVYYHPVASVFVTAERTGPAGAIPTVDFAGRHFRDTSWREKQQVSMGLAEANALIRLVSELRRRPGPGSQWDVRGRSCCWLPTGYGRGLLPALAVKPDRGQRQGCGTCLATALGAWRRT